MSKFNREQKDLLARLQFAEGMRPKKPQKPVPQRQYNHHVKAYRRATTGRRGTKDNHPLYSTWRNMIRRCDNSLDAAFKWYGARGIRVCPEWKHDFWRFVADMGPKPSPEHSIDRIEVDGHYNKTNCRWATQEEQANNKQNTIYITMTLSEWADVLDLSLEQVRYMYSRGLLNKKKKANDIKGSVIKMVK